MLRIISTIVNYLKVNQSVYAFGLLARAYERGDGGGALLLRQLATLLLCAHLVDDVEPLGGQKHGLNFARELDLYT